jgi:hypothetical protein
LLTLQRARPRKEKLAPCKELRSIRNHRENLSEIIDPGKLKECVSAKIKEEKSRVPKTTNTISSLIAFKKASSIPPLVPWIVF